MSAQTSSQTPEADLPELSAALHQAAERAVTLPLDPGLLTGRVRRKRRTRAGLVAGLAVAVLAAGGVAVPRLLDARPNPADRTHHGQERLSVKDVTGTRMINMFERMLPPGARLTGAKGNGLSDKGTPGVLSNGQYVAGASVVYDDGHGAAQINVEVDRWDVPGMGGRQTKCGEQNRMFQCSSRNLPGGANVMIMTMDPGVPPGHATKNWEASLTLPSGGSVWVSEGNGIGKGLGTATRTDPPLSTGQLAAIVENPQWLPVMAAVPKQQSITPTMPGLNTVLAELIPHGFTATRVVPAPGVELGVTTVLSDAQGKGSVFADGETDGNSASEDLAAFRHQYPHAVRLADGDWLATVQKPGQGKACSLQNWAVVQHGTLQVRLIALDSVGLKGACTRSAPVLTLAQLATIAQNPAWRDVP